MKARYILVVAVKNGGGFGGRKLLQYSLSKVRAREISGLPYNKHRAFPMHSQDTLLVESWINKKQCSTLLPGTETHFRLLVW